ncbi:MAG: response regulator [Cyanobacteria bacterium J055]|nr:MAG: response regulator [Cyanobacteria bacterium J055]
MSQDKELEIKLQFLDEAQEYLQTLESALLGLASRRVDAEEINAALRAAHSIKGGAGMMGFQVLSQFAHRLEDSFKVLKIQKNSVEIDGELERLLLAAVDCLGETIEIDRESLFPGNPSSFDCPELLERAAPIFDRLSEQLGAPQEEDASSVLMPEDGQDVIFLLFETEVEGCLERLESVLANPEKPCLPEEVAILAQELGGLGEMLQIEAFYQLCESVTARLHAEPTRVEDIAREALSAWRRSQALILTGQFDLLPTAIAGGTPAPAIETWEDPFELLEKDLPPAAMGTGEESVEPLPEETPAPSMATWEDPFELLEKDLPPATMVTGADAVEPLPEEIPTPEMVTWEDPFAQWEKDLSGDAIENWDDLEVAPTQEIVPASETIADSEEPIAATVESEWDEDPSNEDDETVLENFLAASGENGFSPDEPFALAVGQPPAAAPEIPPEELEGVDLASLEREPEIAPAAPESDNADATVRVSVKRLEQLNDLLAELIIERNGLDVQFSRLRGSIASLSRRVQLLEHSTAQLQLESNKTLAQSQHRVSPREGSPMASFDRDDALPEFDLLELDRYNDAHLRLVEVMETVVQIQEVTGDLELSANETEQTTHNLNKTIKQLQANLDRVRMRPLSDIVDRFPRALRELSLQYGKPVDLKISGGTTLVDRNILEQLHDPLMHLLRNAFDHGIEDPQTRRERGKPERGTIEIRASHHSNRTQIILRDDGGGIPVEKIRDRAVEMGLDADLLDAASDRDLLSLIFEPGFSTKEKVSDLSGRGVGMDVVRNNLKQVRGEIQVETQPGEGTTFTLWLPFTLSVTRVLIAESSGMLMAFPADTVREIVSPLSTVARGADGSEVLRWDGAELPLVRPERWLEFRCPNPPAELETPPTIGIPTALIVDRGDRPVAIAVNRCWGDREVAIRQVEGAFPLPPGFSGCTILGNGRVVPLVNVPEFLERVANPKRSPMPPAPDVPPKILLPVPETAPNLSLSQRQTILIVDDSINVRRFLALTLEKAGYLVEQARDGQDALDKLGNGLNVRAAICDIEMPRLDGYGFLAQIKAQDTFKDLPVVMLTSRTGNKHRQLALSLGATAYFSKPYNEQTLLQTLETVTREPATA